MKSSGYVSPFNRNSGLRPSAPGLNSVSVIVPFYNEEDCVEFVLKEIVKYQPDAQVVAVDDGSSDHTWEIMRGIEEVTPLRLTENCLLYTSPSPRDRH